MFAHGRILHGLLFLLIFHPAVGTAEEMWIYTVADGDNLWDFSEKYLDTPLRFEQLRTLNAVQRPRRMQPGTRLRVPMKWIRTNPVPARLAAAGGSVELIRADGSRKAQVTEGAEIRLGDSLRTGADSTATVVFADGSVLTLYGGSEMRFDHLSAHGETGMVDSRVHLIEGRLDTRVRPAAGPGSRFEIQTPSAISAVRGTEYRAAVQDGAQVSNIEVLKGKVRVSGGRKAHLVPAGFGTQVAVGEAPVKPRRLLPAPQLQPPAARIRELNWPLVWQDVQGARAYRSEISAGPDFAVLVWDRVVERARVTLPDLPDGEYFVRVRGIDDLGLEGEQTVQAVVIDTRPQPPVPLQPTDGKTLRGTAAELQWSASSDAQSYRIEIANDAGFTAPLVVEESVDGTRFPTAEDASPGVYHWRVMSVSDSGEVGPPSVSRSWQLKPVPETVEAGVEATDDGRIVASWKPGDAGQSYDVQLARDPQFKDLEIDQRSAEAQLAFDPMPGQVRYLRVRSVESDGFVGPWGAVQRIDPPPDRSWWVVPLIGVIGLLAL